MQANIMAEIHFILILYLEEIQYLYSQYKNIAKSF